MRPRLPTFGELPALLVVGIFIIWYVTTYRF